jgi:hypothetical protein
MFCPKCRNEFGGDVMVCPDCNIPLSPEPQDSKQDPTPVGDIQPFVRVFETSDPTLLASATSLLDGANIPFAVRDESAVGALPSEVLVPEEYAHDVQELLSRQAEDVNNS